MSCSPGFEASSLMDGRSAIAKRGAAGKTAILHCTGLRSLKALMIGLACGLASFVNAEEPIKGFPYERLEATAFRIMKETHNRETAYASITVAQNGKVYLGPARYDENAYLVELDPADGAQRVVVDVHELCGLSEEGFEAQAKIHTRLFVAPSGTIYFGSQHGYPSEGDSPYAYRGGYLMSYDPASDTARNLGRIPFRGHGIYDVVADEERGLLHITTSAFQVGDYSWYLYDIGSGRFEGLARVNRGAHPLLAPDGRVYALTHDGRLAQYAPDSDEVTVRPMVMASGEPFEPDGLVQCEIDPKGRYAYLMPIGEPVIYAVRLDEGEDSYTVEVAGRFASGRVRTMDPIFGPDEKLYLVTQRRDDDRHPDQFVHVVSYDPEEGRIENHGALAVANPEELKAALGPDLSVGERPCHGMRRLPDGTLYPRHTQGIAAGEDGTIYVMTIYPLVIMRLEELRASAQ